MFCVFKTAHLAVLSKLFSGDAPLKIENFQNFALVKYIHHLLFKSRRKVYNNDNSFDRRFLWGNF